MTASLLAGDRIARRGRLFIHEGLYVGGGYVMDNEIGRGVRLVPFEAFAHGRVVRLISRPQRHEVPSILARARASLGTPYSLFFFFNCEDFVSEATTGLAESPTRRRTVLGVLLLAALLGWGLVSAHQRRHARRSQRTQLALAQ